jgi:hypothetical protein
MVFFVLVTVLPEVVPVVPALLTVLPEVVLIVPELLTVLPEVVPVVRELVTVLPEVVPVVPEPVTVLPDITVVLDVTVVGEVIVVGAEAPATTVRRTSVGWMVTVKCSLELIAVPFTVANVPVSEVKFMILNVLPMVGTKLVGRLMFSVPPKVAVVGFN